MTDQATMLSTAAGRMIGRLAQRRIGYRNLSDGPHSSAERFAASTTPPINGHANGQRRLRLRVKQRSADAQFGGRLCPNQRTSSEAIGMPETCQQRKFLGG